MPEKVLQINFRIRISATDYHDMCLSIAGAFAAIPGLRWKLWLLNDPEKVAGGIYLFESDQALSDFLSGPLVAQVKGHPDLYDFSAKVFHVTADVTAVTRGPVPELAAAAA